MSYQVVVEYPVGNMPPEVWEELKLSFSPFRFEIASIDPEFVRVTVGGFPDEKSAKMAENAIWNFSPIISSTVEEQKTYHCVDCGAEYGPTDELCPYLSKESV